MDKHQDQTRKLRLKNYSIPVLVVGLFILQFFTSERAWEILLVAFGGALLLSTIWAISLRQGLNFRREMRLGWAQVGDRFNEQFTISNKGRFPALAVTIIDHSNFPGYKSSMAWPIAAKNDRIWYMDNFCSKRGLYTVGPTEILTQDPFGIFEISIHSSSTKEILITPPIVPLQQLDLASGDWHGDGGTKSKMFERTVTASSVREYVSGDSLLAIHWLTTARRENIFVRTYDQLPSSDWWIILDMDRYVQLGQGLESTEEYAAIVAASVADRGLAENRAVGLISAGSKSLWLPPKTGAGQRAEIMLALATVKPGNVSLSSLLAKSQQYLARKSSVIIITPSVEPAWLAAVSLLKRRGVKITALLLNQLNLGSEITSTPIEPQLEAWGVQHYQISKKIYTMPKIGDFFPRQWGPAVNDPIPVGKRP